MSKIKDQTVESSALLNLFPLTFVTCFVISEINSRSDFFRMISGLRSFFSLSLSSLETLNKTECLHFVWNFCCEKKGTFCFLRDLCVPQFFLGSQDRTGHKIKTLTNIKL